MSHTTCSHHLNAYVGLHYLVKIFLSTF